MKVKVAAIETLSTYANLVAFDFDRDFAEVWPKLSDTIDDRQSFEPAISSLGVLRRFFRSRRLDETRTANFASSAADITAFLKKAIEHEYSKVVFEGLRVASSFLNALRTASTSTVDQKYASSVM